VKIKQTVYEIDSAQALLWQYNQAARLESLVLQKQLWIDANVSTSIDAWQKFVFDLETATAEGLYVWSIILNLPLYSTLAPSPAGYPAFGFSAFAFNFFGDPSDPTPAGSNFAVGSGGAISGLTIEEQRQLLQMRYFQLITNGSVTEINRALAWVFGEGSAHVLDNLDMTMTYIFNNNPSPSLINALQQLDVLPRPAAVELNIILGLTYSFGFADYGKNFFPPSNFERI
jgi:hypothetical protein